MSSGERELVVNPSERAISTDIMRLQRFKSADLNELLLQLLNGGFGADDSGACSLSSPPSTTNTPLTGTVVGGLLVQPVNGSASVTIAPGIALVMDPDAAPNPDDSQYKFVRDPGQQTIGVLTIGANASGSIRIDVIECARVAAPGYSVIETDNRDIFDPVTGLFSAATVNKVTAGALQYRVRPGTPGAGFPGTVNGWMPLAVASVPNGTTITDTVTFWDVRPLAAARVFAPFDVSGSHLRGKQCALLVDAGSAPGIANCHGLFEGNSFTGKYRLGGAMNRGSPGTDGLLDLNDASNRDSTVPANGQAYLYLLEPFGLPRWCRYTDAIAGARVPRAPGGIPIVSGFGPSPFNQGPNAAITFPAVFGFGASTTQTGCVAIALQTSGGNVVGLAADGRTQWCPDPAAVTAFSFGATSAEFRFTQQGTGGFYPIPNGVKKIVLNFAFPNSVPATTADYSLMVMAIQTTGGAELYRIHPTQPHVENGTGAPIVVQVGARVEIAVPHSIPDFQIVVSMNWVNGTTISASPNVRLEGWSYF